MKKVKYLLGIGILILACVIGFLSLSKKQIKESANAYIKMYMNPESHVPKQLSYTEKEYASILKKMEDIQSKQFEAYFENSGLPITKTQLHDIYEAYQSALKPLDYHLSIKRNGSDKATISIRCRQIDLEKLEDTATKHSLAIIEEQKITTLKEAAQIFVSELTTGLENHTPKGEEKTIQISWTKKDGSWEPEDIDTFIQEMHDLTITKLE